MYPKNFFKIYLCLAIILLTLSLIGVIGNYLKGKYSLFDFVGFLLLTFFMVGVPFVFVTRKIIISDNGKFKYGMLFLLNEFSNDDIESVHLEDMMILGIRKYIRVKLHNGKTFGFTDFYWSNDYYCKIEAFFLMHYSDKIKKIKSE